MDNTAEEEQPAKKKARTEAPAAPQPQKKKKKRRGARLSKAERLAKREAQATSTDEPPLAAISRLCATPATYDAAERVASQADGDDATHLVAFLGCLARQAEPRFRTIAHYGRRARSDRAAKAAAILPKALAAEGKLEAACCVASALGSIQEAAAACALAVDAVAAAGAARARTKSGAPPAEDDDGDSEEEHEVTVDGAPEHAPLAQLSRALSRDASLAERLIVGPCLRANWSSPERRRALKAAATSLKVLRAGAAPGDSAALTAKLLACAAPVVSTRDDAALAAQLTTAAKTLDERAQCVPFGSAATGLGDGRGDVDLCLLLPEPCIFDVNKVAELLKGPPLNAKKATAIATARVPVARATLPGGVRLDVVVNARRESCNTALLKELGARRPQLAPLCRAARAFSRAKKFGGNHRRHLSHYAWTVLCVRVLQLRGELPALPCPALTALAAANTLTWTAALKAANADLDAAGVVKTAEDDGALAGRFVDLLRLVAFARTDIITTRGAGAALPADATKKHRDRLRLQDPLEVGRDLGAVLTRRTSAQLRYACLETYVHLVADGSGDADDAPRPERAFPFLAAEE